MVTASDCDELNYNTVAVGVDKDKNSQQAVKWTIDHFLKGKIIQVYLIHVKVQLSQSRDESVAIGGRAPSESELHQLFLSYRGFFARKGFSSDIYRRFKQPDVPTSLIKSAPDFCAVYVISKGKVQSSRPANRPTAASPSSSAAATPKSSASTSNTSSCWTTNMRSSLRSNGSNSTSSSRIHSRIGTPDTGTPISAVDWDDATGIGRPSFGTDTSQSSLPPQYSIGSSGPYDCSRNSNRESWMSEDSERTSYPGSNEGLGEHPRIMRSPDVQLGWGQNLYHERPLLPDGPSYSSYSNYSCQSNDRMSSENNVHNSAGSTNSDNFAARSVTDELEVEISKLRIEIKNVMGIYQSISEQAAAAKKKSEELRVQRPDEDNLDDLRRARDAALIVADLERLKCKAAMDAAQLSEKLVEMETKKRKFAEETAKREQAEKQRVMEANTANSVHYRIYGFEELKAATNNFSDSLKIGEGGYGPVYKTVLQNTAVAIKILRHDVSQGLKQFQKEIEVLGRIRHPHMVLLLGACPDHGCLVYEYMENGSLEDRLFCKNNTPPIPWKARFRIASEIATALLFLHQAKPEPMVHRDLKPANILLDGNYSSKISDVGLARLVPASAPNEMTQYHMTAAAGTFCYIDPEYQQSGLLGTKSDVYSLGVLLLQLITARPPMALAYRVEEAIETDNFTKVLDPMIHDWPVQQALALAQLALKCCELRKKDRPDLASVLLPGLNRLRDFATNS
ncbi:hypothetical protein Cgig2_022279 [Carnegiea gigantea]|uniref:Protein kinase domain-containing protein n=1 Tax=Carnegiea gigantea TaxID=171969 RepID=A0A9Q1KGF6_9CARY|nr:hypothetical protein Cgig2_022279 [Carnegiea gigantea]